MWREWLQLHYPERAAHVMSLIQQMRGGKDYDSRFGIRMRGEGPFAELLAQRFRKAHARLGSAACRRWIVSKFVAAADDRRRRAICSVAARQRDSRTARDACVSSPRSSPARQRPDDRLLTVRCGYWRLQRRMDGRP